ncbi:hypothetical protein GCM10010259_33750 [Streptomyces daghestanicus]|nr:hypothetical protein GCM10010259_33750 [Streptomyces daghestanicus]
MPGFASGPASVPGFGSGPASVSGSASGPASVPGFGSGPASVSGSASGPASGPGSASVSVSAPDAKAGSEARPGMGQAPGALSVRPAGRTRPAAARRTGADPVKALIHRHQELCRRAVDPLEIAAGLEAHGITDRTANRFRHRDVFTLAEEMYARVPRDGTPSGSGRTPETESPTTPSVRRPGTRWIVLTLLPGALGVATVSGLRLTQGQPRLITAVVGVLAVTLAVRALLRRGRLPGAADDHSSLWVHWLIAYALLGDGLLDAALTGGPDGPPTGAADGPWPVTVAPVLALTLACAPAAWCARFFTVRARRRLGASRGLEEFAASVRPLLCGSFLLFLAALAALLALTGAALDQSAGYASALSLGALLLLARLLTGHGYAYAPSFALTTAATVEATALAGLFASRLPGCGVLATPVEALITTWGTQSVPTVACGTGALVLLLHANRRLTRASAHAHPEPHR